MEADSCQREEKPIDEGQGETIDLVISFVLELKGLTEGFMIISFQHHYY